MGAECVAIWGGSPTLVKMADIYMSLQRGTLDGVMFPTPPLADFRFTDMVNKHTICAISVGMQAVVMNQAKWDSLPPDIQKAFEDLVLPFGMAIGTKFVQMNAFIMSELKKRGDNILVLTPEQRAEWRGSIKPVYDGHTEALKTQGFDGKSIMDKISAIIQEARQKPYKLEETWLLGKQ